MRLLAIDPHSLFGSGILHALSQEGFVVDKTKEVKKGIWMARTNLYEVVLLIIPGKDPMMEVFEKINQDQPSAYLVALIGAQSSNTRIELLEAGLDDVLFHPCSFREFIIRIRSLLRRIKNTTKEDHFHTISDLVFNPAGFSVKRGNREIILRRKEFNLLEFLLRNREKVVTKAQIMEGVWDANADLGTNTLEVHIFNLRKKIDSGYPPEHRLIHTVYGRGYLFGLDRKSVV